MPPRRLATTGLPWLIASMRTTPKPSVSPRESTIAGRQKTAQRRYRSESSSFESRPARRTTSPTSWRSISWRTTGSYSPPPTITTRARPRSFLAARTSTGKPLRSIMRPTASTIGIPSSASIPSGGRSRFTAPRGGPNGITVVSTPVSSRTVAAVLAEFAIAASRFRVRRFRMGR